MSAAGKKSISWVLGLAVLLAAGLGAWRLSAGRSRTQEIKAQTASADRGKIVAKVTATGTLSALVTVQVGSQVSGRISQINVDYNSPVKKGEVIAKIDPQMFQAALEQARANNLSAQSNVKKAKVQAADSQRQLNRTRELAERKLTAPADLDTAQATYEAAEATVEAAESALEQTRAALHQAEINLAYTTIVSPIDGMVVSRNVDVGQTVAASFQAPVLFTIAEDLKKMQVDTNVSEADVGRLQPGMEATFQVDAYAGERFTGKVRQIRNAPQTIQNIVTYDAVIDVENPELKLKPGMTANVSFVYAQKDDVLRIPNTALRFRPTPEQIALWREPRPDAVPGDKGSRPGPAPEPAAAQAGPKAGEAERGKAVWRMRQGRPERVSVVTGVSDGTLSELIEGEIQPGDALVIDAPQPSNFRPPGRLF